MKTKGKRNLLLCVVMTFLLTACALGGIVTKENDGFSYNTLQPKHAVIPSEAILS